MDKLYYREIRLKNTQDFSVNFIRNKVMSVLHLVFANEINSNSSRTGITFPKYDLKGHCLGNVIRLFNTSKEALEKFFNEPRFFMLKEFMYFSEIQQVPDNIKEYVRYSRAVIKTEGSTVKRYAKMQKISLDAAHAFFKDRKWKFCKLPYLALKSQTTKQNFKLFIKEEICSHANEEVQFSSYGLQKNGYLPKF